MSNESDARLPGKFCALPWVHRFTNIGGEIQVCCTSEECDNNIRSDDGEKMNIRDGGTDAQIMNSQFMKGLRKQLLQGQWPELCRRCKITEEVGGISRRNDENRHFAPTIPNLLSSTSEDGTIPVHVKSADYRLGNLCNLACRMCNPYASTPWIKYAKEMGTPTDVVPQNWYESPEFIEHVKRQAVYLEHLHFAGGEPLINPQMEPLLTHLVDLDVAKNISLTYNTNLTRISDRIKALWPNFKGVELYCSVDGYGARNEFIRHPSRWSEIDRNLRDVDQNFTKYGLRKVAIMTTLQIYNILDLEPLYDYLFENMTNVDRLPKLIDLHAPSFLRTQVLAPKLKFLAKARLHALLEKSLQRLQQGQIKGEEARTLETITGAIHFMDLEDRSHELADFLKYSFALDRLHKKSTLEKLPELAASFAKEFDEKDLRC